MTKIEGISDAANQFFTLALPNGETFELTLWFSPQQTGWFCAVSYNDFTVNAIRVTTNPNILAQFAHLLPFGIACFTNQDQEPLFQEDFTANNAALCLLDQTDLAALETYLGLKT